MADWRADTLVDELLPQELDWKHWVRRYPFAALSIAAIGGYLLGRSRGQEIVETVSDRAADSLSESVQNLVDLRS